MASGEGAGAADGNGAVGEITSQLGRYRFGGWEMRTAPLLMRFIYNVIPECAPI
jgi:hypothetical protein